MTPQIHVAIRVFPEQIWLLSEHVLYLPPVAVAQC